MSRLHYTIIQEPQVSGASGVPEASCDQRLGMGIKQFYKSQKTITFPQGFFKAKVLLKTSAHSNVYPVQ